MPGSGELTLTGQLGEVMKESAQIAFNWLRSNSTKVSETNPWNCIPISLPWTHSSSYLRVCMDLYCVRDRILTYRISLSSLLPPLSLSPFFPSLSLPPSFSPLPSPFSLPSPFPLLPPLSLHPSPSLLPPHSSPIQYGFQCDLPKETDLHIHFPAGAIGKDGPSAGVAIGVALCSLYTGLCVRSDTAVTGELTLRGLVLPVRVSLQYQVERHSWLCPY